MVTRIKKFFKNPFKTKDKIEEQHLLKEDSESVLSQEEVKPDALPHTSNKITPIKATKEDRLKLEDVALNQNLKDVGLPFC